MSAERERSGAGRKSTERERSGKRGESDGARAAERGAGGRRAGTE